MKAIHRDMSYFFYIVAIRELAAEEQHSAGYSPKKKVIVTGALLLLFNTGEVGFTKVNLIKLVWSNEIAFLFLGEEGLRWHPMFIWLVEEW